MAFHLQVHYLPHGDLVSKIKDYMLRIANFMVQLCNFGRYMVVIVKFSFSVTACIMWCLPDQIKFVL